MMGMMRFAAAFALIAAASASPGVAAKSKAAAASDADREICRSQSVVGSRLKRVRVCMTAQQWEELKLQEQLGLARKQINGYGGCPEANCAIERGGAEEGRAGLGPGSRDLQEQAGGRLEAQAGARMRHRPAMGGHEAAGADRADAQANQRRLRHGRGDGRPDQLSGPGEDCRRPAGGYAPLTE